MLARDGDEGKRERARLRPRRARAPPKGSGRVAGSPRRGRHHHPPPRRKVRSAHAVRGERVHPLQGGPFLELGEINYAFVLAALEELGYEGTVGLGYNPTTTTEDSFGWVPHALRAHGGGVAELSL